MRKSAIAALTAVNLLLAAGLYGVADAAGVVPGVLTTQPEDYGAAPYPTPAATPSAPVPAGASTSAPVPAAGTLAGYAQSLEADSRLGGAWAAVSVIDVATSQVLVDQYGSTPLTPASSTKLLTGWAVLSALGGEHRLETRTVLSGSTVTLVGGGDTLLAADAGDPDAVVGRAGLGDLARATAQELTSKGITSVSVALDDTLFSGPTWSPDWEAGNEAYVAPVQPIMVDITAYDRTGSYPADPAMDAATAFSAALSAAGITVTGAPARAAAPSDATSLASVESATLAQTMAVSLKASDNTMTEVEGRLLALATGHEATFAGAAEAIIAQLKTDGFDTSGVTLLDASGLARANKVPAALLAQVAARAAGPDGGTVGRTLLADLPVGALDGTLYDRLIGTAGAGTVRAKTGSLPTSLSLSGTVVTADGRLLAFSVIVDGFPTDGLYPARGALDEDFVVPLAGCGCGG